MNKGKTGTGGFGFTHSRGCDTMTSGPDAARDSQQQKINDGMNKLNKETSNESFFDFLDSVIGSPSIKFKKRPGE